MSDKKAEALRILEEGLKELESSNGSVTVGVQKLSRAAKLLDKEEIYAWAQLSLGNKKYTEPVEKFFNKVTVEAKKLVDDNRTININADDDKFTNELAKINELHIPLKEVNESFNLKTNSEAGGFESVDFIEKKLNILIKDKKGNDGYYYKIPLQSHLAYIKKYAFEFSCRLHDEIKFAGTIPSSFDLLKNAVDDRLLDLEPEIAEQLMLAFKSVSSSNKEEWSHALTTCRRLLESLADKLYPANDLTIGKRTFKQSQFVNRLWQFMNDSIESDSNRELAQAHVNFLGSWLEKTNKLTNKGVHDDVSQLEATKAVFHLYLMLADLLDYLDPSATKQTTKPQIATASLDELEALLNVKRDVAKAIVIARVKYNGLTLEQFKEIKGVGPKTIATAKEVFEFN
ncbi:helix-hairpin-helix domain-containing protein [Acinetobacter baumannii]|nr:helix-hairpin-helix domain-containing protein [Acinetobacter baumannii]EKU0758744.1 helix-hairpin-helix domain-containing protein [Acinetobacter baumannii]EKV8393731.1 helix-hairpin-helix domain-containing protein [Acinetobacter baumannii]EKW0730117.1 helix-hairpin-helix domain-containing protein [Acinetobacter baumannii]EKW0738233.1 helix-hairpin-helix domain-containing protein [Acinetobacter baumannii]